MSKIPFTKSLYVLVGISLLLATCKKSPPEKRSLETLRIVVMDPLSGPLACACVEGYAQRKYDQLAAFLEKELPSKVELLYSENLADVIQTNPGDIHLLIGKTSDVLYDTAELNLSATPIARLTGKKGSLNLTGLFVVRQDDPAQTTADLKGYKILFGPKWSDEKSSAPLATLKKHNIPVPEPLLTKPACSAAALAVVEKEADAAVISSYAMPLLEGCGTIDKGSLRLVGQTDPVPFITVFATNSLEEPDRKSIVKALLKGNEDAPLLKALESKAGFVDHALAPLKKNEILSNPVMSGWTDWRGRNRSALSPDVPASLPSQVKLLWETPLTGISLSGIAATEKFVIVADKDDRQKFDIFRCLDADTGDELWNLTYPAEGEMDYSNSPRATPVICNDLVYVQGAFGHLHCLELTTGWIVWQKQLIKESRAELTAWGVSATPLIVDDKIIVNPGAKNASVAALNRFNGERIWNTPGEKAAYASFIVGVFGGVRQIVGYDAISLGGWDLETGKRLWELIPPEEGDFNVPTPIHLQGKLLVMTENNGTRIYNFDKQGKIIPKPLAQNFDLAHDCSSPIVANDILIGSDYSKLACLHLHDNLKTCWIKEDDIFDSYCSLITGNDRVLITTVGGYLILIEANAKEYAEVSRLKLTEGENEIWSHPALVGNRLYVRSNQDIRCILLD